MCWQDEQTQDWSKAASACGTVNETLDVTTEVLLLNQIHGAFHRQLSAELAAMLQ